jgi:mono/diheme cytochrome c family protein
MFAFGLHKITALAPVFLGAAAVAGMPVSASSQQVPLPPYMVAQADAGEEIFQQVCASCHEPDLTGGDQGPPLSDAYFASSWGGSLVADLLSFVRDEMPFDSPGSLDEDAYVDVISYILSVNGIPAGDTPLAMGAPGVITIVAKD